MDLQQQFSVGETVKVRNNVCQILSITNALGFNRYHVIEVDTGKSHNCSKYEMEKAPEFFACFNTEMTDDNTEDGNMMIEDEDDFVIDENMAMVDQPQVAVNPTARFPNVSDEDLNQLAEEKNSNQTKKQTSWAVKILKGM